MKLYTALDIMRASPCEDYPQPIVELLVGDGVTAKDISMLSIPQCHRMWALINVCMSTRSCRVFAQDCAWRTIEREFADGRHVAQSMVRACAIGGDREEDKIDANRALAKIQDRVFFTAFSGGGMSEADRASLACAEACVRSLATSAASAAEMVSHTAAAHAAHCAAAMGLGLGESLQFYRSELETQMKEAVAAAERDPK